MRVPDYAGNRMFDTLGNFQINPRTGLTFIDFDGGRVLQMTGRPTLCWDPSHLGAYLDTCHSWRAGEPWDAAMDMLEPRFAAVALKDMTMKMEGKGRSGAQVLVPPAPQGMVDWDMVFLELRERRFDGPLSVQAEFEYIDPEEAFLDAPARQIRFLRSGLET